MLFVTGMTNITRCDPVSKVSWECGVLTKVPLSVIDFALRSAAKEGSSDDLKSETFLSLLKSEKRHLILKRHLPSHAAIE
jgi:hypothetical protein